MGTKSNVGFPRPGIVFVVAAVLVMVLSVVHVPRACAHSVELPCTRESNLDRIAIGLLATKRLPRGLDVQRLLGTFGSDLPNVRLVRFGRGPAHRASSWLESRSKDIRGDAVCGYARRGRQSVLIVGDRLARLESTKRRGSFLVKQHASLASVRGFSLDVTGAIAHAPVENGRLQFAAETELVAVQLMGIGKDGPQPVARWGATPAAAESGEASNASPDLHGWLRTIRNEPALGGIQTSPRPNRSLDRIAESYASRICQEARVQHQYEGSNPVQRLRSEGLIARDVGEVLVRAPTYGDALGALLGSASHRMVLRDRRMTDVGFGTSRAGDDICVVGVFASWPRAVAATGSR